MDDRDNKTFDRTIYRVDRKPRLTRKGLAVILSGILVLVLCAAGWYKLKQ